MSKTAHCDPNETKPKTFEPMPIQYLFKREGIYVFRRKIPGTKNAKVVSLKTTSFEQAKELLKTENDKFEKAISHGIDFRAATTVGQLVNEWFKENDRLASAGKLSQSTTSRYKQTWRKICRK